MLNYLQTFPFELMGKLADALDHCEVDVKGFTVLEMAVTEVIDELQAETLLSLHCFVIAEEEKETEV